MDRMNQNGNAGQEQKQQHTGTSTQQNHQGMDKEHQMSQQQSGETSQRQPQGMPTDESNQRDTSGQKQGQNPQMGKENQQGKQQHGSQENKGMDDVMENTEPGSGTFDKNQAKKENGQRIGQHRDEARDMEDSWDQENDGDIDIEMLETDAVIFDDDAQSPESNRQR